MNCILTNLNFASFIYNYTKFENIQQNIIDFKSIKDILFTKKNEDMIFNLAIEFDFIQILLDFMKLRSKNILTVEDRDRFIKGFVDILKSTEKINLLDNINYIIYWIYWAIFYTAKTIISNKPISKEILTFLDNYNQNTITLKTIFNLNNEYYKNLISYLESLNDDIIKHPENESNLEANQKLNEESIAHLNNEKSKEQALQRFLNCCSYLN